MTEAFELSIPLTTPPSDVGKHLSGTLHTPSKPDLGTVVFAHGSGSSRFSPRNQFVAKVFQQHGLGTFLMDLLTPAEEIIDDRSRALRFDIELLERRVVAAVDFLDTDNRTRGRSMGTFGASTGGAAALWAAHDRPSSISCAVSRGGRPDLVPSQILQNLKTPTLLIVGGDDTVVLELNKKAYNYIPTTTSKELKVVPGATHLFEEPGTLEQVAKIAAQFFVKHLRGCR
ncbi:Alpha/Beta hydrolase protein [Phlyctochytrium arcticum]|nr:Alpha/Beta hydrolase protein [Phlyctochytrium arcticum]